jgi:hypothetical protein
MTLETEIARLEHELPEVKAALATERARGPTSSPALSTCVFSGWRPRPACRCRWRIV